MTKNNHSSQQSIQNRLKPWSRWTTAAEDHTDCRSCQLRTENMNQHCKKQWKRNRRLNWPRFLLRHSDARVTLWCKNIHHHQLRLVVWGIFFLARNGPLSASWAFLSTVANLSTLADKCRHRAPLGCAGMGHSYMNVQQLCDAVVSVGPKSLRKVSSSTLLKVSLCHEVVLNAKGPSTQYYGHLDRHTLYIIICAPAYVSISLTF